MRRRHEEARRAFPKACAACDTLRIPDEVLDRAMELFGWLTQWRDTDGGWWTGYQFAEQVLWPLEKPTWTAGAVLLAADALTAHSGASQLFLKTALSE